MFESRGNKCFEFHSLMSDRMSETQHVGMQAQAMKRVVTVAVFDITAYGMPHVGGVHPYLVFSASLKPVFHKRMFCSTIEHVEMCHCIFAAVIYR